MGRTNTRARKLIAKLTTTMKTLTLTAGPIPAKLDSVKLITNKFKGGLALKTAIALSADFKVTVILHESTQAALPEHIETVRVSDVTHYCEVLQRIQSDTFVLAGAVANLMPLNPWKGKFPSHNYKVGDVFNIPFTIAPRAIDHIRQWHPNATLIAYKLFDGSEHELIEAGLETIQGSKAHTVFCNHPAWAKERKIAITQDGSTIPMSFDEHINWIKRTANLEWYRTTVTKNHTPLQPDRTWVELLEQLTVKCGHYRFGTIALRTLTGFITTARGKESNKEFVHVKSVDHHKKRVTSENGKPTLNAPTLDAIFSNIADANVILHGHRQLPSTKTHAYKFPGTTEEVSVATAPEFNIEHHGFYKTFRNMHEAKQWVLESKQ